MLEVLNISKSYNRKIVLNDISFSIAPGVLTGITGENGSGKSTLLKIIMGVLKADRGTVQFTGSIGYSPQESLVFPMLTIKENFHYFASAYRLINKKKWKLHRDELVHQLGLTEHLQKRVDKLSGGTRQKLNLLIGLLHEPDICILDEPYGGFDWETYQHFWELILQLKRKGKSILLVTHLLNDLKYFDNILTLKDGQFI
jgi:ABC-2 type transport system ATP-binding protein